MWRRVSPERITKTVGAHTNFRRALALWLVTTLLCPCAGSSWPLSGTDSPQLPVEHLMHRLDREDDRGLQRIPPGRSSLAIDVDGDDRAILDDLVDQEAALDDGACPSLSIPAPRTYPALAQILRTRTGVFRAHAIPLSELCRLRC